MVRTEVLEAVEQALAEAGGDPVEAVKYLRQQAAADRQLSHLLSDPCVPRAKPARPASPIADQPLPLAPPPDDTAAASALAPA